VGVGSVEEGCDGEVEERVSKREREDATATVDLCTLDRVEWAIGGNTTHTRSPPPPSPPGPRVVTEVVRDRGPCGAL
jgi:hypothetical protein